MKELKSISIIALVISFSSISCNTKTNKEKPENFDWLLGKWERKNEEQGKTTFENWEKTADNGYSGIGFTMLDGDTIQQEKMKLIRQNGTWDLIVKVPKETESVTFRMAESDHSFFTCINDSINFPKQIKYWTEDNELKALVAGTDLEILFEFENIE